MNPDEPKEQMMPFPAKLSYLYGFSAHNHPSSFYFSRKKRYFTAIVWQLRELAVLRWATVPLVFNVVFKLFKHGRGAKPTNRFSESEFLLTPSAAMQLWLQCFEQKWLFQRDVEQFRSSSVHVFLLVCITDEQQENMHRSCDSTVTFRAEDNNLRVQEHSECGALGLKHSTVQSAHFTSGRLKHSVCYQYV